MTERLYLNDTTRQHFAATVIASRELDGHPAVRLDRTAFYPAGGGQPHDTGTLNDVAVAEVRSDGDAIWHLLSKPLAAGSAVQGRIHWPRRWDHMQNHSGQHILTQAFLQSHDADTVAWRLSDHTLTIDLNRAGLDDSALLAAETLANAAIQRNLPITARLVDAAELPTLALRKQPAVNGPVRVVEIAGYDRVACAGTHVASTAEVGLIKILRSERRGTETRIHFVCGGRALADYQRKHEQLRGLAAHLGCAEDEVATAVHRLQAQAESSFRAWRQAQAALVSVEATRLTQAAPPTGLVSGFYPDWDSDQLKQLTQTLRGTPGLLIALGGAGSQIHLARSADRSEDAGALLRAALQAVGGRGGGRPDSAQGAAPTAEAAHQALQWIVAAQSEAQQAI